MKYFLAAFRALVISALVLAAAPARAAFLSDLLLPGHSLQVDDKLFDNFSYLQTGDMPPPSSVNVVPFFDGSGNPGLMFQGAFLDFPGGGGSDALIGFRVTVLNPNNKIIGATLSGNPSVIGGNGVMSITETFLPDEPSGSLNIYDIEPGLTRLFDSTTFSPGIHVLHVQKDILAFSAGENGGIPTLSFFTETFPQSGGPSTPEPSSIVLLALGLLALPLVRRYRRKA